MARKFPWTSLPDEKLLQLRLKDLKVTVEGTWLEDCLAGLYDELDQRDICVRPHAWISDEWFAPNNTPGIAIPFYLAHPRLMQLERKKILEVEGGTVPECMRILRHEAGHVVQFAFQLHRRRQWQKLFGRSSKRYPSYYRPNPASKNYVEHLRLWYAQSHPDEDFAETFAVWLKPRSNWRKRYADWPALEKLEYVDALMTEIAGEKPVMPTRRLHVDPLRNLDRTLADHYKRKLARYVVDTPRTYDSGLSRIFTEDTGRHAGLAASAFLRENRAEIRELVSKWTGEHKLTLDTVLDEMIRRARELKLRAVGPVGKLRLDVALLVTAETVHSLYSPSRRQWFAL